MKKLFLSLVVFTGIFNIGCQETMLNDPFDNAQLNEVEKNAPQIRKGTIVLSGNLEDPTAQFDQYYLISGVIEYQSEWKSYSTLTDPVNATTSVKIALDIKAEISNSHMNSVDNYIVSGNTKDVVYIGLNDQRPTFKKSFPVKGSKRSMNLVCLFAVSQKGLTLISKWLEAPEPSIYGVK